MGDFEPEVPHAGDPTPQRASFLLRLVRWSTVPFWSRLDGFVIAVVFGCLALGGWSIWPALGVGMLGFNVGTRLLCRWTDRRRGGRRG